MRITNFGIYNKTRGTFLGANISVETCSEYSTVAYTLNHIKEDSEIFPWQVNCPRVAEKAINQTVDPLFSTLDEPENPYFNRGEELEVREIHIEM